MYIRVSEGSFDELYVFSSFILILHFLELSSHPSCSTTMSEIMLLLWDIESRPSKCEKQLRIKNTPDLWNMILYFFYFFMQSWVLTLFIWIDSLIFHERKNTQSFLSNRNYSWQRHKIKLFLSWLVISINMISKFSYILYPQPSLETRWLAQREKDYFEDFSVRSKNSSSRMAFKTECSNFRVHSF